MAKRFIDSNLFQKDWFLELNHEYQILYIYMFSHCDVAGIFDPNLKTVSKLLNYDYSEEEVLEKLKGQVIKVKDKWLLKNFIKHQYGTVISPKMIKPVENALRKIGLKIEELDTVLIEYRYGIDTPKEKEIEKEKEIKEGGVGETKTTTEYFEVLFHQYLPVEFWNTWQKYIDHQHESGVKIHRHNVISHIKAFKECWQNGISPPILLEAFQQSSHKGLYWVSKNLIREKEDGIIKSGINKNSVKSRLNYKFDEDKARNRLEELSKQFDK